MTVIFRVPWADRFRHAAAILGVDGGMPIAHPTEPGLFARELSICGLGPYDPEGPPFAEAEIAVSFRPPDPATPA